MPCKHEGGTDSCEGYSNGRGCKARAHVYHQVNKAKRNLDSNAYRQANKAKYNLASIMYKRENYKSSQIVHGRGGDSGYAGELVVRTDLLLRGLVVTVPENRCVPDDVHFLSTQGWVSVQVKVTQVNKNTGHWNCHVRQGKPPITSDVIAWVDLRSRGIRYAPNIKPVPPELLT